MAGRHGGVEVAEPAAALSTWGREERPRGQARVKGRARVAPRSEGEARGAALPRPGIEERRRRR
jgi:hypothetical protein